MTVLRSYFPDHFTIEGNVLKINTKIVDAQLLTIGYSFSGGPIYFLPSTDNPADVTDIPVSRGIAFDEKVLPLFFAMNPTNMSALDLVAGGGLRITHIGGADTGAPWPTANDSPQLMFPLPACDELSVLFEMEMGNFSGTEVLSFGIAKRSTVAATQPSARACVTWTPSSTIAASESMALYDVAYPDTTALGTFITANVCRRSYRLKLDPANVRTEVSDESQSSFSDFISRSSALQGGMSDLVFYMSVGTSGVPAAGYYAELKNLFFEIRRAYF